MLAKRSKSVSDHYIQNEHIKRERKQRAVTRLVTVAEFAMIQPYNKTVSSILAFLLRSSVVAG
jgi:hypothetical protein